MQELAARFALALALSLAAPLLPALEVAPNVLLQSTTPEVVAAIQRERDQHGGQPAQVATLVETKVLPLFDFSRMTQLAVARDWRTATPEQKTALTAAFKTLLVRAYSSALSSYKDQVIEFKSVHSAPSDTEVTVKSVVKQSGTAPITIDYDMEKTPGGWKVYDIKVAGISLVTNYRDSFAEKIRDDGVDGLIKALEEKNLRGASQAKTSGT